MGNAEEGGDEATVEAGQAIRPENLARAVEDGGVGARVPGRGGEHARFDHPDRIRQHGRQGA